MRAALPPELDGSVDYGRMRDHDDHLALSTRHLAEATARIERLRELIDRIRGLGLATARAEAQLTLFEDILESMLVHDRIIRHRAASE
jgi:hypothetical protein